MATAGKIIFLEGIGSGGSRAGAITHSATVSVSVSATDTGFGSGSLKLGSSGDRQSMAPVDLERQVFLQWSCCSSYSLGRRLVIFADVFQLR